MSCNATFFNAFYFLTQLFNNFFFFSIRKIRLHSWYHLRRFWRMLEIFGDGRHFDFLLQLCCLLLFWSITPNMESMDIRIFEYNSKRMRWWEKKWNRCIAKQFWTHIVAEIHSLHWKWIIFYHTYWFAWLVCLSKINMGKSKERWSIKF